MSVNTSYQESEIERKIRQRKAESYRKAEDGEDERINPEN